MKVREVFPTFEDYNTWWHKRLISQNAHKPAFINKTSMYFDGQFDEWPYIFWKENVEVKILASDYL